MSVDKQTQILDAVLAVLGRNGLAGVTMRAVAAEADVALGLMNYHFEDKDALIAAALERVGQQDAELVAPTEGLTPVEQLSTALERVADPEFLDVGYLSVRLQLWSLAPTSQRFAEINRAAQRRYRDGLLALITEASPAISHDEADRRAGDILIIQNGLWLTSVLIVDPDAVRRSIDRCLKIALAA